MITRHALALIFTLTMASTGHGETTSVLTLDSLSFVSFQNEEVLAIPSGAQLTFHFAEPSPSGSVSFTISPGDVQIPEIPIGTDRTLKYGLASAASGTMVDTPEGRKMSFSATVSASPNEGTTFLYAMPFTTETTESTNLAGNVTIEITGMRLIDDVWYVQLVGATVNKHNAFPEPGAAVYTVLSGQFDQLSEM